MLEANIFAVGAKINPLLLPLSLLLLLKKRPKFTLRNHDIIKLSDGYCSTERGGKGEVDEVEVVDETFFACPAVSYVAGLLLAMLES